MNSYSDMNVIDENGFDLIISKQELFYRTLLANNNKILDSFNQINLNYQSNMNSKDIVLLQNELFSKLLIMQKNNNNNLELFQRTRDKYIQTSEIVSEKFKDI